MKAKEKRVSKSNKSTSSTKKANNNEKVVLLKKEISGIFIVALAIFLIIVTNKEEQTGIIGKTINMFTHTFFGKGAIILPYVVLVIGVMRLLNIVIINDHRQIIAIIGFFISYIMYAALLDNVVYNALLEKTKFIDFIKNSISLGMDNVGGGILGNVTTYILVKLVGKNGTLIVLGSMIFILIIIFTNQSIIGALKKIGEFVKKIFAAVYNFIFTDIEQGNKRSKEKIKKKPELEENIQIYDYTNISDNKSNSKITQLKIDEIEKSDVIKDVNSNSNASNIEEDKSLNPINNDDKQGEGKPLIENDVQFESKEITDDIINIAGVIKDNYEIPPTKLLNQIPPHPKGDKNNLRMEGEKLIETLNSFNIQCNILQINKGPTITRFELQPAPGIKVSRITSLTNDIALSMATSEIRIEAPIPGKSAIGIEVPNKVKTSVVLRSLIESKEYKSFESNIPFALGKDIAGKNIVAGIEKMPHLLIAGATGSGKSVCINSLIMSILFKAKPDEVKLILVDPKVVELSVYNGIPHLLIPVVTDPRKAANALNWAVSEMTNRYKIFAQNSVRDIFSYNEKMIANLGEKMAQIVIIIDELADLMTVASNEVEEYITRIAQLARACGIHLVIATQRPSVDVITGVIKANIPSRIAFAVSSQIDSRTILDSAGAEKLLGKGDMLYHPMGMAKPIRIQGTFISDDEIKRVVDNIREQNFEIKSQKSNEIIEEIEKIPNQDEKVDEYLEQAIEMVVNDGQASASYIQRKFKVGYSRAARIIDQLEERGIVGGHEGSKPRKVLITKEELDEMRGN
ncbi:MAG: DNA translocase FtsK 4TM domain-containing protein [Tissierellia bacterium]|nr:DNA translocase FtsK 4TM domain-containing protein [Tissierellia bacterium]